jgi:hypothetical protein
VACHPHLTAAVMQPAAQASQLSHSCPAAAVVPARAAGPTPFCPAGPQAGAVPQHSHWHHRRWAGNSAGHLVLLRSCVSLVSCNVEHCWVVAKQLLSSAMHAWAAEVGCNTSRSAGLMVGMVTMLCHHHHSFCRSTTSLSTLAPSTLLLTVCCALCWR